jgi:hypothetical protein
MIIVEDTYGGGDGEGGFIHSCADHQHVLFKTPEGSQIVAGAAGDRFGAGKVFDPGGCRRQL